MTAGQPTGKIVLVTGAGRGIDRGCALALAADGADVVVNDLAGHDDAATSPQREAEQRLPAP